MPDAIYIVIRLSFHDFTPNLREQSCGGGYKKQEPSKISLSSFYLSESTRLPSCNCPSLVQLSLISILRKYMSEIELDVKNLVSGRVSHFVDNLILTLARARLMLSRPQVQHGNYNNMSAPYVIDPRKKS